MKKCVLLMVWALMLCVAPVGAQSNEARKDNGMAGTQLTIEQKKEALEAQRQLTKAEQKRLQQQIDSLQHEEAVQALRDSAFTLEAKTVVFKYGQRAYVMSHSNFVRVDKGTATVQVSFNVPVAGPNGMGGVTLEGNIGQYELTTDKRGNTYLSFNVMGTAISAQVFVSLYKGGNEASVNITSNFHSRRITLEGVLLPTDQSFVVQGRTI